VSVKLVAESHFKKPLNAYCNTGGFAQTVGVKSGQKHLFCCKFYHPNFFLDKNESDTLRIFHIKVISFTVLSIKVPYLKSIKYTFHIVFTVAVYSL
jgi:hypothetical protein